MNQALEALDCVRQARQIAAVCNTLEELTAAIILYDAHPLATMRKSVPPRSGDRMPARPVMLLGKSPASTETQMGLPFQGPAGQLLRECIYSSGNDIEMTRQSHATSWRPAKDNTPNATQIAFSRPFLEREIELLQPSVIIALGANAADSLMPEGRPRIEEMAGQSFDWRGIPIHVLRNHGFVLRDPRAKPAFIAGLAHGFSMRTT